VSSLSGLIEPEKWSVRYAPPPEDIYWENINNSHTAYMMKASIVNVIVFIVLVRNDLLEISLRGLDLS
jgi:hypothetical protein